MPKPSHINLATEQAYFNSHYHIFKPNFTIKIGQTHPELDEFLVDNSVFQWAFISAYNPYSEIVSDEKNEENHRLLIQQVHTLGYYFVAGEGRSDDDSWLPEKSLFILGITEKAATQLAKSFQQNAIIVGAVNQKARLVWCVD